MIKKILRIVTFLLFVVLGISLIKIGLYLEEISSPKYLYKSGIDIITSKSKDFFSVDEKYYLGDDFSVKGKTNIEVTSEEYPKKALTDPDYLKKNNIVNNFNKMTIDYELTQDKKDKKILLSIDEKNPTKSILNYKLLVENSTEFYYVEDVLDNFINDGSNNYFEMFQEDSTTVSNMDYMYEFVSTSLAKQLGKYAEKYEKTTTINNSKEEVNQVSVKLTNKIINNILNGILDDIKKDKKANTIMTSVDSDFSKRKVEDNAYLSKNESYTINVYCSKYLNKPLKYEILYLNKDKKKIYSYEGDNTKGLFYYSEDDNLKYSADYKATKNTIDIKVKDKYQKDAGSIKLNKDANNTLLNISLNLEKSNYDIIYSRKYKNYTKNKSYEIEDTLSFKIMGEKEIKLSGEANANTIVNKDTKIEFSPDTAVFTSKLSEEQKDKFGNIYENVKRRLENEQ